MTSQKSQLPTALKIGTLGQIDRKIGFQDIKFREKWTELTSRLNEREARIRKKMPDDYPKAVFMSEEYEEIEDFIIKSFYWKEGKYEVELSASETLLKNPHVEKFEFELTKINSESLERNIEFAKQFFNEMIHWRSGGRTQIPKMFWNWAYPTIERKKEETSII